MNGVETNDAEEIGAGTVLGFVAAVLMPILGLLVGVIMYVAGSPENGKKVMLVSAAAFLFWLVIVAASSGA